MDVKRILVILALVLTAVVLVGAYVSDRPDAVEAISQKWSRSTHSDSSATAFTNWDEDDPPAIPVGCAKCHSTYGFLDFLGEDGTEAGVV
ncbi:MAG: hypothetical protein GX601_18155, partial [Anaerolineales bacterium]|nr:hypothetical protein [Anaerolineales bacterium]